MKAVGYDLTWVKSFIQPPILRGKGVYGHVDSIELGRTKCTVRGWIASDAPISGAEQLSLVADAKVVPTQVSLVARNDLPVELIEKGACGFQFVFDVSSVDWERPNLHIRVRGASGVLSPSRTTQKSEFTGHGRFDEFANGYLRGWVNVRDARGGGGEDPIPELYINSIPVGAVVTDMPRQDVVNAGLSDNVYTGFRVNPADRFARCPKGAENMTQSGELLVELRVNGRTLASERVPFKKSLKGKVERASDGLIRGWAVRNEFPESPCEIGVFIENTLYASAYSDLPRVDLKKIGLSGSTGGFKIALPNVFTIDKKAKISLRFLPERQLIKGGELAIELKPPTPTSFSSVVVGRHGLLSKRVSIIVPIYNAADDVRLCLESLSAHTTSAARLILIDDASPDPRISEILSGVEGAPNVVVLRNEKNLGFTATVNRGIEFAESDDVVFLNSDTLVTPRWLENLHLAAYNNDSIGTVTPFSDNAGAFSVPEMGQENAVPVWTDHIHYARSISHVSGFQLPRVPTGNGFCMFVKRSLLDDVGLLDVEAFPRGYGEENDLCMRAQQRGWQNIICDFAIVFHKRSASFGEAKAELMKKGRSVIDERYPEYSQLIRVFRDADDIRAARFHVRAIPERLKKDRQLGQRRILYIISTQTGGTPQTNADLMRGMRTTDDTWLLICDAAVMKLHRVTDDSVTLVATHVLKRPIQVSSHRSHEYDEKLANWLCWHSIEIVHIRHFAWHSLGIADVCNALGISLVLSFHDYYAVCPTVKLLDENRSFCGGVCTPSVGPCTVDLWPPNQWPDLKHKWVYRWKSEIERMFRLCDAFVTTSNSAKEIILKNFPILESADFRVIEHGRDMTYVHSRLEPWDHDGPIKILCPGNIGIEKGAEIINALTEIDGNRLFEFHMLGNVARCLKGARVVQHGAYARENFAGLAKEIGAHFGAVFSIWPETYCHTLTELWSVGLPVLAFDQGAVGERIKESGGGWLLPSNPEELLKRLVEIAVDKAGYEARLHEVWEWQRTHSRNHDVASMARDYRRLYNDVIESRRPFGRTDSTAREMRPLVAVVTRETLEKDPAEAFRQVSLRERTDNSSIRRVRYEQIAASKLLDIQAAKKFDLILLQDGAVSAAIAGPLLRNLKKLSLPLVLDLDDNFLSVYDDYEEASAVGGSEPVASASHSLIREADMFVVSTPELVRRCADLNSQVVLVHSKLPEKIWFGPLQDTVALPDALLRAREPDDIRILSVCSMVHSEDLDLVRDAVCQLRDGGKKIAFFVVGASSDDSSWFTPLLPPAECSQYSVFVGWLRQLSEHVDFVVAPRTAKRSNLDRSELEFLEYAALGLTGLFSDAPLYREVVKSSGVGRLVAGSSEAWAAALAKAVNELDEIKADGKAAQRWVERNHLLKDGVALFDSHILHAIDAKENASRTSDCKMGNMAYEA